MGHGPAAVDHVGHIARSLAKPWAETDWLPPLNSFVSIAMPPEATDIAPQNAAMSALAEARLRAMMTSHVGVIRDGDGLADAVRSFAALEQESGNIALRNMATAALLVAASAWSRRESRGAHDRSDYPAERPQLAHRTMTTLAGARQIAATLARATARPQQSLTA